MKEIFLDVICAVLFEKPLSSVLRTLQSKPKKRERQKLFLECLLFYDQSDARRNRNKPQQ